MAADQVGQPLDGALVGHVLDSNAGLATEIFADQVAIAADAGGGERERPRARLAARDELIEALHRPAALTSNATGEPAR